MATPDDLEETVRQVEALDRRIVARPADVRDVARCRLRCDEGVAEFGRLDIVCANAGVCRPSTSRRPAERRRFWQDMIDVNLTGVWHTVEAAIPPMIEAGRRRGDRVHQLDGGVKCAIQSVAH